MLNCSALMAASRGMCLRTTGLISYTALKKEGCFFCPHGWRLRDTRLHYAPLLCLLQGFCRTGGFAAARAPVPRCFRRASATRLTKGGMCPCRPHGLCTEGPSASRPRSSPPLLQQDGLPALEDTMRTNHSSPHHRSGASCVPKGGYCRPRCSPLPPKCSKFKRDAEHLQPHKTNHSCPIIRRLPLWMKSRIYLTPKAEKYRHQVMSWIY